MAIAFDASADGGLTVGTTLSWSHTCTGANLILYVGVFSGNVDLVTGITYNSVAMTFVGTATAPGDRAVDLWRLVGPSTGSNTVTVTISGSDFIAGQSVSYTGAAQSAQPDTNTTNTASATSISTSVTTATDQDWAIMVTKNDKGAASAGTATTQRQSASNGLGMWDTNAAISPAGSVTLQATFAVSANWGSVMEAFKPAGGGGARGLFQPSPLSGLGSGGSGYFRDPLGAPLHAPQNFVKRNHIYVPERMAA